MAGFSGELCALRWPTETVSQHGNCHRRVFFGQLRTIRVRKVGKTLTTGATFAKVFLQFLDHVVHSAQAVDHVLWTPSLSFFQRASREMLKWFRYQAYTTR